MIEAIVVAVITALGSLIGTLIVNNKHQNLIAYRLEQLEKKVDLHNKVIERTYALEKENGIQNEKIDFLEHELKEIRKD